MITKHKVHNIYSTGCLVFVMKGFHFVLLALATYFSAGLITAVSVPPQWRDGILAATPWLTEVGLALFVLGCIALRLAVHFKYWVATAGVLVALYTTGLTLIGIALAVCLQSDFDREEMEATNMEQEGLRRGQMAVCLGCVITLLVFVIVQTGGLFPNSKNTDAHAVRASAVQSGSLVLLFSGVCLVAIDDHTWDWRYAVTVFFSLVLSVYLNTISTWMVAQKEEGDAFHVTALIILQPILFAESWVLLCLLDSAS